MKSTNKLLLLAAVFALALPLVFSGTAGAMYMEDGARPDGLGGWKSGNDMVCIVGVHMDGTLDIADGVTNSRDCIYLNKGTMNGGTAFDLTTMTTSAACTTAGGTGNDGAKHAWATSGCWDGSGNPVSLKGLDRTSLMCTAKGGTWVTSGKCVAYGRQFKGIDASGTPLAFSTKGTSYVQGTTGYCYAAMNFTAEATPSYTSTTCPSVGATTAPFNANAAYDWSFASTQCRYAKGIAGLLQSALTKADGTTYAAASYKDLSVYTTMGDCIANGGTWNNWTFSAATSSIVGNDTYTYKRPSWDYTRVAPDSDSGCLHCHNSQVEYNGPAEREKDSYLKTGHKNMLRKVTAGIPWAGPDANGNLQVYTTDGTNAIHFMTGSDPYGKITVSSVDQNLYYIYGDWMAPLPSVVYGTTGYGSAPGATNGYSCYACHATGASDNTAPVPGVQSIGTPGYAGVQPGASFPGISLGATNPKWDLEGIQCARCHNAAVAPINAAEIAASSFPTTAPHSGGMGALASGTGRNNLCFGCHQSAAKVWPSGATQYDPTLIPTGVSHGAAAGREFNGHVLGESFLNSVHGKYAGVNSYTLSGGTRLNALGKYDLNDPNGTTEYGSIFKGYTCWQSPTSSSPAKTKDATGAEIKDKATCEGLYGVGSWRADTGDVGVTQGTCTTCHDVHKSLFVAGVDQEGAIRKECVDCHVNNATTGATDNAVPTVVLANINHPTTNGTPFKTPAGVTIDDPCAVCHMATQAKANGDQTSMPVHLWRMSTNPTYSTFPTTGQFYGGTCTVHSGAIQNAPYQPVVYLSDTSSAACTAATGTWAAVTKDRNAQIAVDGTYSPAVWVDLDLSCGQCHVGDNGGTIGQAATGAPVLSKSQLSVAANGVHDGDVWASTANCAACHTKNSSNHHSDPTCSDCHGTGSWPIHQKATPPTCLSCHSSAQGSYPAIVPGIPGKNHHGMVPGETAECTECHGADGGVSASHGGYSYTDSRMCLSCHTQYYPSGIPFTQGVTHHNGTCVTCHQPSDPFNANVTGPGVIPVAYHCNGCHTNEHVATMNHPQVAMFTALTCDNCHNYSSGGTQLTFAGVNPGIIPCAQCHGAGQVWPLTDAVLTARANGIHQAMPDYVVLNTYVTPTTVAPSGSVSITDVTVNQSVSGAGAGPSTTAFYVVSACTTTPSGSPANTRTVPALAAGANSSGTTPVPMPSSPGTYYIVAKANDNGGAGTESNPNNNTKCSSAITVTGALPDLYIVAVSAPASATHGVAFSVTDRTANKGGANAGISSTGVYVADGDLTGSCPTSGAGATFLNSRAVPILVPSGGNTGSMSVTIATTGTKTLIWMADYLNAVTESNENNNTYCKKITVN